MPDHRFALVALAFACVAVTSSHTYAQTRGSVSAPHLRGALLRASLRLEHGPALVDPRTVGVGLHATRCDANASGRADADRRVRTGRRIRAAGRGVMIFTGIVVITGLMMLGVPNREDRPDSPGPRFFGAFIAGSAAAPLVLVGPPLLGVGNLRIRQGERLRRDC